MLYRGQGTFKLVVSVKHEVEASIKTFHHDNAFILAREGNRRGHQGAIEAAVSGDY